MLVSQNYLLHTFNQADRTRYANTRKLATLLKMLAPLLKDSDNRTHIVRRLSGRRSLNSSPVLLKFYYRLCCIFKVDSFHCVNRFLLSSISTLLCLPAIM